MQICGPNLARPNNAPEKVADPTLSWAAATPAQIETQENGRTYQFGWLPLIQKIGRNSEIL
jgi:hypothetical protein